MKGDKMKIGKLLLASVLSVGLASSLMATTKTSSKVRHSDVRDKNDKCITCHLKESRALVHQWENSAHQAADVGCYTCHAADKNDL